mmetsp:Transcript_14206/g.40407  ORF Transcript_14206/g.40407 Transcript_14206/m.40407 type:complete len:255 (+) Transcript_14206:1876-2640(+)
MAWSGLPSLNAWSPWPFKLLVLTTTSVRLSGLQRMRSSPLGPSSFTSNRPAASSLETMTPLRPLRSARLFRPLISTREPIVTTPGADGASSFTGSGGFSSAGGGADASGAAGSASSAVASVSSSSKLTSPTVAFIAFFPARSSASGGMCTPSGKSAGVSSSAMPSSTTGFLGDSGLGSSAAASDLAGASAAASAESPDASCGQISKFRCRSVIFVPFRSATAAWSGPAGAMPRPISSTLMQPIGSSAASISLSW